MNNQELFNFVNCGNGSSPSPSHDVRVKNWITSAEMPSGITAIPDDAFNGFSNLRNIEFNSELTTIGARAFYNCEKLNITIEDSLAIGENAFYGCGSVGMVTDTKPSYTLDASDAFYGCDGLTVFIPEGTTTIAEEAFMGCEVIKEVVTPNSVTEIQARAFMDCSNLKKATIVSNASEFRLLMGIFSQCYNLEEVTLPNSIKFINAYTFYKNYNLKRINIPDNLVQIRTGAFFQCNSLTNITLPNTVQYLGSQAFCDCRGLKTISIPNSITEFGDKCFGSCSALENVVLESGFNASGLDVSASSLFSVDTLVSMLNALADRTSLEAYTLVLGSANLAKLSNEEIAIATEKNWTVA